MGRSVAKSFSVLTKELKDVPIIFYSEGKHHSAHLFPIAQELIKYKKVVYVTSDTDDFVFKVDHHNLHTFYIGVGSYRTLFFKNVSCRLFITSLPDLNIFHIKKSRYPVYYIYIHHSIVSAHMAYRPKAFDHFDEIFCVGPHHIKEIRAQETINNLPTKKVTPHGNARLDKLILGKNKPPVQPQTILIAPSWGDKGLFETHTSELLEICKNNPQFTFIFRPHPETIKNRKNIRDLLVSSPLKNVTYDDGAHDEWLYKSEIMISDWSGAAYEFALGLGKPVIFIDSSPKVNNGGYGDINLPVFENVNRCNMGILISLSELHDLRANYEKAKNKKYNLMEKITELVFNVGHSASVGACVILERLNESNEDLMETLKYNYNELNKSIPSPQREVHVLLSIVCQNIAQESFSRSFINILTKKIDVGKKLWTHYDDAWKKLSLAHPLNQQGVLVVCYFLLLCVKHYGNDERALMLKAANSLLNACSLYDEIREKFLDFFQYQIKERL